VRAGQERERGAREAELYELRARLVTAEARARQPRPRRRWFGRGQGSHADGVRRVAKCAGITKRVSAHSCATRSSPWRSTRACRCATCRTRRATPPPGRRAATTAAATRSTGTRRTHSPPTSAEPRCIGNMASSGEGYTLGHAADGLRTPPGATETMTNVLGGRTVLPAAGVSGDERVCATEALRSSRCSVGSPLGE
jgi:hypothetical protein